MPTAAISSGNQGDFVFVVNPGPTPEAKRKNKPATDASGKVPADEEDSATTAKTGDAGKPQKPKFHADQVNVHVDFTIGTNSILSDGALQANQQVVVDGQEKLVDGGNVTPQQAKGTPGQKSSASAGASSNSAGAPQPTTSTQNDGVNGANSSGNNPNGGSPSTSNSGGAGSNNGSGPR